jgi:hypothetical protein
VDPVANAFQPAHASSCAEPSPPQLLGTEVLEEDAMIRITVRDKIKGVVAAWERAYPGINTPMRQGILTELKSLDLSKASAKEVTAIIGNPSWVTLTCDDCRKDVDAVVQAGEEPEYDSGTANLCVDCLRKALALIESKP